MLFLAAGPIWWQARHLLNTVWPSSALPTGSAVGGGVGAWAQAIPVRPAIVRSANKTRFMVSHLRAGAACHPAPLAQRRRIKEAAPRPEIVETAQ